jgi:hypothetical protein
MSRLKKLLATVILALASAGTAGLLTAAPALADTLIQAPPPRVCHYHKFAVGVWAQPGTSWANRRYVVNAYNPHGVRVLHKAGHAPSSHWLIWHVKAWKLGRYHTIFKTWKNGTPYKSKYVTRSHRCS